MIPREILKKIPQIGRRTNRIVTETLAGQYHSVFKGQGMNFDEVREYQPGDDVRAIDWNVTARMNHPFIKKFVEERELTLAQYGGAPFARNLETALGKISQLTGVKLSHAKATSSIKVVGAAKADLEHFDILDAAIKQRQPVEFAYRKLGEAEETKESRKVHPHHVACTKGRWYLAAYDLKRQAMRTFSLSRMEKLVVLRAPPETLFSENRIGTKANEIMFIVSGNWSFRRCPQP